MIFVTVGTHEQQFNRLIKAVDDLKKDGIITDDVFIQTGYSTYEPEYCKSKKFLPYKEMEKMYQNSDIIITHGGPASFMKALQYKKIPIVVPRQVEFKEHVNNHQLDFCKSVFEQMGGIILVDEIEDLKMCILEYNQIILNNDYILKSNNQTFCNRVQNILDGMIK